MITTLFYTLISLIYLALIFIPLEKVFPLNPNQNILRHQWKLDLTYFFCQYLIWGSLVLFLLSHFAYYLQSIIPSHFQSIIQSQPIWLQSIEVIILSDLLIYWGHRFQHHNDFLWRFHKVHHTSVKLDWLAAHREHPLDTIYTVSIINLPAFIIGFDLDTIITVITFRGIWAIYIHSNVKIKIGFLKKIIGSPELHHWHHSLSKDAGNYANISPLMDILFGTYYDSQYKNHKYGIKEEFPSNYIGQLTKPLLPEKKKRN